MPGIDLRFARQPPITVVVAILFGLSWAGADKGARASTFTSLYSFCKQQSCADGQAPASGLTIDSHGHLFGATIVGGANGDGVVFELLPNNDGTWKEKVLYSFCSFANCSDGASPFGPPILDTSGNLYGTAGGGGSAERGVVFELQKNQNTWTYIVRYNFCGSGGNCDDGYVPTGWLTYVGRDAGAPWNGSSPLFGVASAGGVYHVGVAYRLMPGASWTQDVIHNFHTASTPSPLAAKSNGDLFGTT